MSVQFSGGEPTMSPYFFDAVAYARKIGYNKRAGGDERHRVREEQGVFARRRLKAGMRYAYLQFDGIGKRRQQPPADRQTCFDVKLRAIENMHEAGIEIVLVVTIVNNVNNDQVGTVVKFAMENPKKNRVCKLPAGFVYRARRRHHSGTAAAAALHAFAPGAGRQRAGGQSRADGATGSRFRS